MLPFLFCLFVEYSLWDCFFKLFFGVAFWYVFWLFWFVFLCCVWVCFVFTFIYLFFWGGGVGMFCLRFCVFLAHFMGFGQSVLPFFSFECLWVSLFAFAIFPLPALKILAIALAKNMVFAFLVIFAFELY